MHSTLIEIASQSCIYVHSSTCTTHISKLNSIMYDSRQIEVETEIFFFFLWLLV